MLKYLFNFFIYKWKTDIEFIYQFLRNFEQYKKYFTYIFYSIALQDVLQFLNSVNSKNNSRTYTILK